MVKYGLIAVSSILPRFVEGLKNSQDSQAWALSSRDLAKAKTFAETYDIPYYYDDYHQLLKNPEVAVVYISSTNLTHYQIARDALLAGKSTIVEKPFTATYQEAEDLVKLAKEKSLFLMEGQKVLFLPTTAKIKELIDAGVLGSIEYFYLPASSFYDFSERPWMNSYQEAGGALMGSSSYGMAFVSYLTNSKIVTAQALESHLPGQADYLTSLSFQTASGVICNTILGGRIQTVNQCYIYGTAGHIMVENFWKSKGFTLALTGQSSRYFDFPYQSEFTFYIDHVSQLLRAGKTESPIMTLDLSLQSMKYMDRFLQEYKEKAKNEY